MNGQRQEGFAKFDRNISHGRRLSAARAYLHPVMSRPNLTVRTRTFVDRILFNHTGTLDHPPEVRVLIRSYLGLFQVATGEWLWYGRATRATTHTLVATTLITLMRETLPALLGRSAPPASMTDGDG